MSKTDNYLQHHGILGMKWGIRRQTGPGGTVSETSAASSAKAGRKMEKAEKAQASGDYTKARELKRKAAKTLSNAEIKALNERLQLEQNLSRLNPNALKKGQTAVKAALAVSTTISTAYGLYKSPAGQKIKEVFAKKAG